MAIQPTIAMVLSCLPDRVPQTAREAAYKGGGGGREGKDDTHCPVWTRFINANEPFLVERGAKKGVMEQTDLERGRWAGFMDFWSGGGPCRLAAHCHGVMEWGWGALALYALTHPPMSNSMACSLWRREFGRVKHWRGGNTLRQNWEAI